MPKKVFGIPSQLSSILDIQTSCILAPMTFKQEDRAVFLPKYLSHESHKAAATMVSPGGAHKLMVGPASTGDGARWHG